MERHTGRFSFYCEMCNKGFNNSNHYKTHMQAHEGIRYHCTLQEHHKFLTKATISIISDPLKSMGGIFLGILC